MLFFPLGTCQCRSGQAEKRSECALCVQIDNNLSDICFGTQFPHWLNVLSYLFQRTLHKTSVYDSITNTRITKQNIDFFQYLKNRDKNLAVAS